MKQNKSWRDRRLQMYKMDYKSTKELSPKFESLTNLEQSSIVEEKPWPRDPSMANTPLTKLKSVCRDLKQPFDESDGTYSECVKHTTDGEKHSNKLITFPSPQSNRDRVVLAVAKIELEKLYQIIKGSEGSNQLNDECKNDETVHGNVEEFATAVHTTLDFEELIPCNGLVSATSKTAEDEYQIITPSHSRLEFNERPEEQTVHYTLSSLRIGDIIPIDSKNLIRLQPYQIILPTDAPIEDQKAASI